MTTFSGAPLWTPVLLDQGRGTEHRSYLRLDGKAWRCQGMTGGHICQFVLEPRDIYGCPRLVLAEEILEHARTHGVEV